MSIRFEISCRLPRAAARWLALGLVLGSGPTIVAAQTDAKTATAHFATIDTDRDAKLDRHELTAAADQDFNRLDIDKDGLLTRSELSKTRSKTLLLPFPGRLASAAAFAAADTDRDNEIDKHEYETAVVAAYLSCDRNHDGTIELSDLAQCSR